MITDPEGPFLPHGGYGRLRSYKVAEAVYDATVVFCRRFFAQDRRQTDQMVQAARSGVRNISEGSGAAATSRKTEMKLTNVARASLNDELLPDYTSFLTQRGLRVWPKESREAKAMRTRLAQMEVPAQPQTPAGKVVLRGLSGLSDFVAKAEPEIAANAMVCAVNQAAYLLTRQLQSQGRAFLEQGGFTESLYAARTEARNAKKPETPTEPAPPCPNCGQPMVQRTAKTGPKKGEQFWGCSTYPQCRGIRPAAKNQGQTGQTSQTGPTKP